MSEEQPEKSAPTPEPEVTEVTPFLFPEGTLPERPDLVEMVKKGAHKFTGERLHRDRELCRAIVGDLLLGLSDRAISRKYRVSRNSILGIEQRLRATGEMDSVRTQMISDLDDIILIGLRTWQQKLIDGEIPGGQIPIPVLAAVDKKVQLEAGVVLGTGRTERELNTDDLAATWEKIKSAGPIIDVTPKPTVENVSTAKPALSSGSDAINSLDGLLDGVLSPAEPLPVAAGSLASAAAPAGPPAPAPASRPPAAAPAPDRAQGGGGGSPAPAAGGVNHTHPDDRTAPPE